MLNISKILFVVAIGAMLAACEPTVKTYENDADLRKAKIKECAEKVMEANEDPQCKMAMQAQANVVKAASGELMKAITMEE